MLLQMALFHPFSWLNTTLMYICTISLSIPLIIDIQFLFLFCQQCCSQHWGAYIFWNYGFLWIYISLGMGLQDHMITLFLVSFLFCLTALGLPRCAWAFSGYCEWGLLSNCSAWASHRSAFSTCKAWARGHVGFSSCGPQAQLRHRMWNLPEPGIKPVFTPLAGGSLSPGPPSCS